MKKAMPKLSEYAGRKEGDRFERKSRDAVSDSRILPRAVCALLNANGGEILIGIEDHGEERGIPNVDEAERSVQDRLVSTIVPSLPPEVVVQRFEDFDGLLIRVPKAKPHTLYAVKSSEGRFYVPRRSGARTLLLDWSEITRILSGGSEGLDPGLPEERAREELDKWCAACEARSSSQRDTGALHLVFRSDDSATSRVARDAARDALRQSLMDPTLLGVRAQGWHFSTFTRFGGHRATDLRELDRTWTAGDSEGNFRSLQWTLDGAAVLRFATRLDHSMRWSASAFPDAASSLLHPMALSETVSSCTALFARLLRAIGSTSDSVGAAIRITGTRGLQLPRVLPNQLPFLMPEQLPAPQMSDVVSARCELPLADFLDHPHALARLLLVDIHRSFGHEGMALPHWNDAETRFVYS